VQTREDESKIIDCDAAKSRSIAESKLAASGIVLVELAPFAQVSDVEACAF
jgi:hypothetical protein